MLKKFCIRIFQFLTGLLLVNIAMYAFISKPVLFDEYIKSNIELLKNHRIFLFADSHGRALKQTHLNHIGVYNFSFDSESYYDMYFKLDYLIKNNIYIDTILITADDHILSSYREIANNTHRSVMYSSFQSFRTCFPVNRLEYLYIKYGKTFIPMFNTSNAELFMRFLIAKIKRSGSRLLSYTTGGLYNLDDGAKTTSWVDLSAEVKTQKAINRFNIHYSMYKPSKNLKKVLKAIFALCKENGIHVKGVRFPLAKEYLTIVDNIQFETQQIFKQSGIQIIDMKSAFVDCADCFEDQDHLNEKGSEIAVNHHLNFWLSEDVRAIEYQY